MSKPMQGLMDRKWESLLIALGALLILEAFLMKGKSVLAPNIGRRNAILLGLATFSLGSASFILRISPTLGD